MTWSCPLSLSHGHAHHSLSLQSCHAFVQLSLFSHSSSHVAGANDVSPDETRPEHSRVVSRNEVMGCTPESRALPSVLGKDVSEDSVGSR